MIRCLTVRQPWAWAIFHGKDIENREWPTRLRGRIAIHAAKGLTWDEYEDAREYCKERGLIVPMFQVLLRGWVLGAVELVGCVERSESPWFEGKYGFMLHNPEPFKVPIPAKGSLGFWTLDPLTEMAIERQQTEKEPT